MSEVQAEISKLLEPLWARHAELIEKRDGIAAELAAVNEEVRATERVLKAGEPEKFIKENENGGVRQTTESRANADRILRTMWAEPAKAFTFDMLVERTGLSISMVKTAVQSLRSRGDIRHIGRMPKKPGAMGAAPMGFKVAEGAQATEQRLIDEVSAGQKRSPARENVSDRHVESLYRHLLTEPDKEWKRRETYDLLGIHEATMNMAWRVLEDEGKIEVIRPPSGGKPGIYKVVTNGS